MALGSAAISQGGGNDKKEQRKRSLKNSLGSWKRGQGKNGFHGYSETVFQQQCIRFLQQMNGPTSLFGSETYMGIASPARSDYSGVFSSTPANVPVPTAASSLVARNPLEGTHELRQACQACFIKKGEELGGGLWGDDWG